MQKSDVLDTMEQNTDDYKIGTDLPEEKAREWVEKLRGSEAAEKLFEHRKKSLKKLREEVPDDSRYHDWDTEVDIEDLDVERVYDLNGVVAIELKLTEQESAYFIQVLAKYESDGGLKEAELKEGRQHFSLSGSGLAWNYKEGEVGSYRRWIS
jgi:hypothetical protein